MNAFFELPWRHGPAIVLAILGTVVIINALWVVASALLIIEDPFDLTGGGRWLVGVVAALVADLAIIQAITLRRQR